MKFLSGFDVWQKILFVLLILIFVSVFGVNVYRSFSVAFGEEKDIIGTVTDKNVKRVTLAETAKDVYLVYTEADDGSINVFQITDSILARRFNSSDVYAGIKVGTKYHFYVRGRRVPIFSWYPNIYDYKVVE